VPRNNGSALVQKTANLSRSRLMVRDYQISTEWTVPPYHHISGSAVVQQCCALRPACVCEGIREPPPDRCRGADNLPSLVALR